MLIWCLFPPKQSPAKDEPALADHSEHSIADQPAPIIAKEARCPPK
jgi:hypothetical protein